MSTPEEREAERRRRAFDLLADLHVVERLSELGPVEITGAVAHRLAVAHDIDMDVTVDELDAKVGEQVERAAPTFLLALLHGAHV